MLKRKPKRKKRIERWEDKKIHQEKNGLKNLGKKIEFFPGIKDGKWFDRVNKYVKQKGGRSIKIKHYIVSAGMKEIILGIPNTISRHFDQIYASEYHYGHHKCPTFANVVINDTVKTQYLFRINKGKECINENINEHMAEENRPIPFANMIYHGDGDSDVPCMSLTKKMGGHAIAVYKPNATSTKCKKLMQANRIDYYSAADYRKNSSLDKRVKLLLDLIIAKIKHAKEMYKCGKQIK